jgi:hypothetical protein
VISSVILWFSQSCEAQGWRRQGRRWERRSVIRWILPECSVILCFPQWFYDFLSHFMIFSVILWGTGAEEARASVGEALSHSLDFTTMLSHFVFSSVILWFCQSFYDFLSHFVRHSGGGGKGVSGRDDQSFFAFYHSAQSFCVFLSDFVISLVILWFSQSFCEAQGWRRQGRRW